MGNNSSSAPEPRNAMCILLREIDNTRVGLAKFTQFPGKEVSIEIKVDKIQPPGKHGIHIHTFGDLTDGCKSAGAHYNPENLNHGGPYDIERHVGDLGNISVDENGNGELYIQDRLVTLFGDTSVVGRSLVLHHDIDDLGRGGAESSKTTGNSGARIACGSIVLTQ